MRYPPRRWTTRWPPANSSSSSATNTAPASSRAVCQWPAPTGPRRESESAAHPAVRWRLVLPQAKVSKNSFGRELQFARRAEDPPFAVGNIVEGFLVALCPRFHPLRRECKSAQSAWETSARGPRRIPGPTHRNRRSRLNRRSGHCVSSGSMTPALYFSGFARRLKKLRSFQRNVFSANVPAGNPVIRTKAASGS